MLLRKYFPLQSIHYCIFMYECVGRVGDGFDHVFYNRPHYRRGGEDADEGFSLSLTLFGMGEGKKADLFVFEIL